LLALGNAFCITMQMVTAEGWLDIVLDAAKSVAALVLQICMLLGIRGISQGAEYEKLARKAARNIGMLGVYYVLYFLVLLTAPLYPENVSYVSFIVYLYWFVCFICNLLLIHSSFGMFYPAEGDPMENRRSKIPLFNKISDAFDRLEEKTNRYREESMKMALEEAEKKAAEKNRHKKKKKRK